MAQEPEYIYPPNSLKSKITVDASTVDMVAIKQADMAIEDMAGEYLEWVKDDIANLQGAYEQALADPSNGSGAKDDIYGFAHDIKGQGGSFGYPMMTAVGNHLCKFIEGIPGDLSPAQLTVIKVYVDTLRVVIQERMTGNGGKAGERLLMGLDAVVAKVTAKA